jgi:nucleoside-diphosphate kinase
MKMQIFTLLLTVLFLPLTAYSAPVPRSNEVPSIQVQMQQVPLEEQGPYNSIPHPINNQVQPIGAMEQTLSIIKPDAVASNHIGDIISRFEREGLRIAAIKMALLTQNQAGKFYNAHHDRPFYPELVKFMSSGPVVVMVLEGENAIAKNRQLMGATNPQKAERGTIRAEFAESVTRNAVHGSDSPEAAQEEISFFFQPNEIFKRF